MLIANGSGARPMLYVGHSILATGSPFFSHAGKKRSGLRRSDVLELHPALSALPRPPNSLPAGNLTGNFSDSGRFWQVPTSNREGTPVRSAKIPSAAGQGMLVKWAGTFFIATGISCAVTVFRNKPPLPAQPARSHRPPPARKRGSLPARSRPRMPARKERKASRSPGI